MNISELTVILDIMPVSYDINNQVNLFDCTACAIFCETPFLPYLGADRIVTCFCDLNLYLSDFLLYRLIFTVHGDKTKKCNK